MRERAAGARRRGPAARRPCAATTVPIAKKPSRANGAARSDAPTVRSWPLPRSPVRNSRTAAAISRPQSTPSREPAAPKAAPSPMSARCNCPACHAERPQQRQRAAAPQHRQRLRGKDQERSRPQGHESQHVQVHPIGAGHALCAVALDLRRDREHARGQPPRERAAKGIDVGTRASSADRRDSTGRLVRRSIARRRCPSVPEPAGRRFGARTPSTCETLGQGYRR